MQADTVDDLFRRFGPNYRWYVTFSGLIGGFSMVLSATIVNVAVPDVMGAFSVGQDQAQWMADRLPCDHDCKPVAQRLDHGPWARGWASR